MTVVHIIFEIYCAGDYYGQCEGELEMAFPPSVGDVVHLGLDGLMSSVGMLKVECRTFLADQRALGYGISISLNDLHLAETDVGRQFSRALESERGFRFWPASS